MGILFEADEDCRLDRVAALASIRADWWNVHGNREQYPDGFSAADFMPGARILNEEEKLLEFAERVMAGDTFDDGVPDAEEMSRFERTVRKTFNNVK